MKTIPSFDAGEVELLVSAVQKTLHHLREANERLGGNDAEVMEAGRPICRPATEASDDSKPLN